MVCLEADTKTTVLNCYLNVCLGCEDTQLLVPDALEVLKTHVRQCSSLFFFILSVTLSVHLVNMSTFIGCPKMRFKASVSMLVPATSTFVAALALNGTDCFETNVDPLCPLDGFNHGNTSTATMFFIAVVPASSHRFPSLRIFEAFHISFRNRFCSQARHVLVLLVVLSVNALGTAPWFSAANESLCVSLRSCLCSFGPSQSTRLPTFRPLCRHRTSAPWCLHFLSRLCCQVGQRCVLGLFFPCLLRRVLQSLVCVRLNVSHPSVRRSRTLQGPFCWYNYSSFQSSPRPQARSEASLFQTRPRYDGACSILCFQRKTQHKPHGSSYRYCSTGDLSIGLLSRSSSGTVLSLCVLRR